MNGFGYLEEVLLYSKELLCNSYLLSTLELYSMLTLVYMVCILFYGDILNIGYQSIHPMVLLLQENHLGIFTITFFYEF
jgi:hypothetical protein